MITHSGEGFFFVFFSPCVVTLLILHVYTLSCPSSHFQLTPWLMSQWGLGGGGGISARVNDTDCVCLHSSHSITHCSPLHRIHWLHSPNITVEEEEIVCSGCPCQLPTWKRVVRKTHHSHRQGPKLIKSTVDSVKRKVYPSHFLVSGNGTRCLVVIASRCHAESIHILMNAAICMHKQLLRVYQSKLLYLQWTRPQQWLGFVNKPLSI